MSRTFKLAFVSAICMMASGVAFDFQFSGVGQAFLGVAALTSFGAMISYLEGGKPSNPRK